MMHGGQKSERNNPRRTVWPLALLVLLGFGTPARSEDFSVLCADRTAVEQVNYRHRLGTQKPFEQVVSTSLIEQLVRDDLRKEATLKKNYGVEITAAVVDAEMKRIDATTRAPDVLAELKAALGNDPVRFARAFARPIVVERTLRARFENDDALHAAQRGQAEQARENLLAKKPINDLTDVIWQLTPRPEEANLPPPTTPTTPTQIKARSSTYNVEATAQVAQVLNPKTDETDKQKYFEDLDPELQKVLRAQLQKPGDVSAVIETPSGFLVFLVKEKSTAILHAASLVIPKRGYEEWLAQQPENKS